MADDRTLLLSFDAPAAVVVPAHHEEDRPVATRGGFPHGTEKPEIAAESPRAMEARTSVTATSTATAPMGIPPSRLDYCASCASDCEIAPRQREIFRRCDGRLLCRKCYQREKRA